MNATMTHTCHCGRMLDFWRDAGLCPCIPLEEIEARLMAIAAASSAAHAFGTGAVEIAHRCLGSENFLPAEYTERFETAILGWERNPPVCPITRRSFCDEACCREVKP